MKIARITRQKPVVWVLLDLWCMVKVEVISAEMMWYIHAQRAPQTAQHYFPVKLLAGCDISSPCQSDCIFIPSYSNMARQ